jgi:hypothetical protein
MRIDYHDLGDEDFDGLVVAICVEILGSGVVPFSSGADGSRDARFEGRAANFPNSTSPHEGKFIIQAKHTENPVAKYSDPDFSGATKSSVITKELSGIKRLVKDGHLDIYLLFSNRRMSGVIEGPIVSRIKTETGAKIVELFGIERMDLMLKKHSEALNTFGKQPLRLPLLVTCDDMAEVIIAISENTSSFESAFDPDSLARVAFKDKNAANGLSADLAEHIRKTYLPKFADVQSFLSKPGNASLLDRYNSAVHEFNEQIVLHRTHYATFDDVLIRITQLLFLRDGDLARRKPITKLLVYYMYWNCDIASEGEGDAETQ